MEMGNFLKGKSDRLFLALIAYNGNLIVKNVNQINC